MYLWGMNKFAFFCLPACIWILTSCDPVSKEASQATADSSSPKTSEAQSRSLNTEVTDKDLVVAFYNVENLFDTADDPLTSDNDFTPGGKYAWTQEKYAQKLQNLAKVIEELDADMLGLAEVENREVLADLIAQPGLKDRDYQIVHTHSKDTRGIDVALIYKKASFAYEDHESLTPRFSEGKYLSRDILWVKGTVANGETLHLMVNHWPSRRSGREESEPKRLTLARLARGTVNKIQAQDPDAKILLMGDFNDDPHNRPVQEVLNAKGDLASVTETGLYNPMRELHKPSSYGSLTYQGKWNLFDQIIMSKHLVTETKGLHFVARSAEAYQPEWLQVGYGRSADAPRRMIFRGEFREDGFSDHFPVRARLVVK